MDNLHVGKRSKIFTSNNLENSADHLSYFFILGYVYCLKTAIKTAQTELEIYRTTAWWRHNPCQPDDAGDPVDESLTML